MKKIFLLLTIIGAMSLASCDNDKECSLSNYWVEMGTIQKVSPNTQPFFILLDNGDKVWPAVTNFPTYNPKEGQRIIAGYSILTNGSNDYNHDIKLYDVYEVLTKPVVTLTEANADSIGNDPMIITNAWIASGYLNIEFRFFGYNKRHMVNLVKSDLFPSTPEAANLQFRQNAYNDEARYQMSGIVSFNIALLQVEGATNRKIMLTYSDPNGESRTIELKYDWSGTSPTISPITSSKKDYSAVK